MFNAEFFKGNRERLAKALPDSYVLIAANSFMQSSADTTFTFRQDSSFWYLTGLDKPDLVLGLNTRTGESAVFIQEQNDYQREWDGSRDGPKLVQDSGVDLLFPRPDMGKTIKNAIDQGLRVCYLKPLPEVVDPYGFYSNPARRVLEKEIKEAEKEPKDIRLEIARLRQVKQPIELKAIQKALDITGSTLKDVRTRLKEFKTEKDLERAITSGFFAHGSDGHGYTPIVASGKNAAIIHYTDNNTELKSNEIILLDVGATVGYYSADISRSWISDKASARQKEVHEAVLDLQQQAFTLLKPGVKLRKYQKEMEKRAAKVAKRLGIEMDKYPHGFSHFLGLDVHDAGDYEEPLCENSVLTVEPGLYLAEEGIGVRIEDVVRITKDGIEVMSKDIPNSL